MLLKIIGRDLEITPALQAYAKSKTKKLERHFNRLNSIEFWCSVPQKGVQEVEAKVCVNKACFFAVASEENMYQAIDILIGKLDRQLKKIKEKRRDNHKHMIHGMRDLISHQAS